MNKVRSNSAAFCYPVFHTSNRSHCAILSITIKTLFNQ
nr:MAG TPA: hypothetical protein [Caudoviricetes sp.]